MITITAFRWVPPFARGLVRDLRVRWALEEAGLPYRVRLIEHEEKATPAYRALQPFGQVPAYEEDGLKLFESGAIVLHLAERSEALAPADPAGRARMTCWMFAAVNSVEPALQNLAEVDFFHPDARWAKPRRLIVLDSARTRLKALADELGGRDYLEGGRFTAADLMMSTVLLIARHTELVAEIPSLDAYLKRCTARPAYRRALHAQMADFTEAA